MLSRAQELPGRECTADYPARPAVGKARSWLPHPEGTQAARRSLTVPGRPEQAAAARRFVAGAIGRCHPLAETAVLLASELVANSLLHSASARDGGTITITVDATEPEHIRVEVTDDGAACLPSLRPARDNAEDGRGLQLVAAESAAWNCSRNGTRTTTWFGLAGDPVQTPLDRRGWYLSSPLESDVVADEKEDEAKTHESRSSRNLRGPKLNENHAMATLGHDATPTGGNRDTTSRTQLAPN